MKAKLIATQNETIFPMDAGRTVTIYGNHAEVNGKDVFYTAGDFRSNACIELLKEADIVCTNPPFSLFRQYIAQLIEYEKKFVILGNQNAITYKEIFPLIKNDSITDNCTHIGIGCLTSR